MKALIVDDHGLIRVYLKHYLEEHFPDYQTHVLTSISAGLPDEIIAINPELVILDISLDTLDTLDFFIYLKKNLPNTIFIIYTMHNITSYKQFFWKNGASAYVLKEDAQLELKDIISATNSGKRVFPILKEPFDNDYRLNQLTFSVQEKELLEALIETIDTDKIAAKLHLSSIEVLNLRLKLLQKTNAKSSHQLIKFALDYNWIR